jgi:hypothetical protein
MATLYGALQMVTDGLMLYLDAGNPRSYAGSGTAWNDVSGNGRNFSWVSTPTFAYDGTVPYFATISNRCSGPASNSVGITNTSGYTVIIMCKVLTLTESHAFKFYKNNLTGSSGRGIAPHLAWTDNNIYFDQGGCCGSDTRVNVASGGTTDWTMFAFRRLTNSSTRHIIKNGSILATNTNSAAALDLDSRAVDLGSSDEFGGNSSAWNARINSFMVYNKGLTDAEILQNYNATRSRFGL